jgi:hypothetical protein
MTFIFSNCDKDDPIPTPDCGDTIIGTWTLTSSMGTDTSGAPIDVFAMANAGQDSTHVTHSYSKTSGTNYDGELQEISYIYVSSFAYTMLDTTWYDYNLSANCDTIHITERDSTAIVSNPLPSLTSSSF